MTPTLPSPRTVLTTAVMLVIGALGGALAMWLSLPMPWMLGALTTTGIVARFGPQKPFEGYGFPMGFRTLFVSLIGVMIGTQVTPDLIALAPDLTLTLGALFLFVPLAHMGNMLIFRQIGGYDRPTAFFSGTPGGLMESIFMGEAAGADIRVLTIQQFLRIILVITVLPLGLTLWTGHAVGSSAGLSGSGPQGHVSLSTLAVIVVTGLAGLQLGRLIRLPAAQLTGPLLLAAAATVTGIFDLHLPYWLIALSQLVIGTSLGLRFQGIDGKLLRRSLWLSGLSVGYMMAVGAGFAALLHAATGLPWLHIFIAFAPGGVAEMSLVALSLAANPALVSLHHVTRILITVVEMPLAARLMKLRPEDR